MEELIAAFPEQWKELMALLLAPIAWIPRTQEVVMDFFLRSPSLYSAAAKYVVLAGFVVRMVLGAVRQVALMPFTVTGQMAQRYFQPGVPWVAFVALLLWC